MTALNVQGICEELNDKGVQFHGKPRQQPWGTTLAHFKDPDGNVIILLGNNTT